MPDIRQNGRTQDMEQDTSTKRKTTTISQKKKADAIFIYLVIAWPLIHFCIFWLGMNASMFFNSFRRVFGGDFENVFTFENYTALFEAFAQGSWENIINKNAVLHSLSLIPLIVCINIPLTLIFAYGIFRKYAMHKFFQIAIFCPTVISAVVLCRTFSLAIGSSGFIPELMRNMGLESLIPVGGFLGNPNTAWNTILVFSVWTGISSNLIYFSSAMGRLSGGVLESAEIDGASHIRQFFSIVIPMIWPTITTITISTVSGIFGWYLPTALLTSGQNNTSTLGYIIFVNAQNPTGITLGIVYAMGVLIAIFGSIIMFSFKKLMEHFWQGVEY